MKPAATVLLVLAMLTACGVEPAPEPPAIAAPTPDPMASPQPAAPVPAVAEEIASAPAPAFSCRGNEPFWSLDIGSDGSAVLRTPESETALSGTVTARPGGAHAFQATEGDAAPLLALLAPAQCFDSMADGPAMPFSIQLDLPDGQVGNGCCAVVEEEQATTP